MTASSLPARQSLDPASRSATRPQRRAANAASSSGEAFHLRAELREARAALAVRSAELAQASQMAGATLEASTDGILVTDPDGRVVAVNDRFLHLWELPRAEVESATHEQLAQRLRDRLRRPEAVARRVAELYEAGGAPDPANGAVDLLELLDGRELERRCSARNAPGPAPDQAQPFRVWSYRDVTPRLDAEAALRDEAGMLHFLNRIGAAIVSTLDIDRLLQIVIDAATQVSGASFGAFLYQEAPDAGSPIPRLALAGVRLSGGDPFDRQRTAALFEAAWSGGGRTVRCADVTRQPSYAASSAYFGLRDGFTPVRSFLAVPVTLRDGSTVGGLFFAHPDAGVFGERTERIVEGVAAHASIALENARLVARTRQVSEERERLAQAERAARAESVRAGHLKDEFLSTLSHELRTPLTAILGWAKVLLLQADDDPVRRRGLEAIERNASSQAALIEGLLDMSRIVSGKVPLDMQPLRLRDAAAEAVAAALPAARARGVALDSVFDDSACSVRGDAARLRQVVASLLSNALKFTPAGGRIEVRVDAPCEGAVELSVADDGAGIDAEFLPHVFDRFRQEDATTTRRHGGLGLGLAVVRQLVGMHGGAVSAASEGAGRGARFVVRLPCTRAGPACEAPAATAAVEAPVARDDAPFTAVDLHGLDLLVVDDETDARELIVELLTRCGARVRQAADADDALRQFQQAPPDVLLSDIGMPGRDGYALLRDVRQLQAARGGAVPAVALTAFARSEDRAQAMLSGFQAHLPKPIRPEELVATVARLADRRVEGRPPQGRVGESS